MRIPVALVALLLCDCAHRVECSTHGGPVWHELRTQHFMMLTDLPIAQARAEALDLEELRIAIRWFYQLTPDGDDFTDVLFLRDEDELLEFVDLGGFANTTDPPEAGLLVSTWAPAKSWRRSRVIPHELAHRFSSDAFPPSSGWLEEGTAAYLETIKLKGPWAAKLGGMGDYFGFDGRPLSLEELWAIPWFGALTGAARSAAYASAWAYVHYLTNHEPEKWAQFLARRRIERDAQLAFEAIFTAELRPAIEKAVTDYKDAARFRSQNVDMTYDRRILSEAELPPWRVHLLRRLLEQTGSGNEQQKAARVAAEKELARSLAPTPLPWLVEEALADGDKKALRAAALAHPEEYQAHDAHANEALLLEDFPAALNSANAALALRPAGPSALRILGLAQLRTNDVAAAASNLERAQRMAPWSVHFALGMAQLVSAQGKCAELSSWIARVKLIGTDKANFWDTYEKEATVYCAAQAKALAP